MRSVSVVIVTFNSSAHVGRCLDALAKCDVPVELVMVDNDSEDDTVTAVERWLSAFPDAQLVRSPANVGFARGVNAGMRRATGDYIVILNPDCYVGRSSLSTMIEVMDKDESIGLAGCLLLNEDGSEQAGCRRYLPTPWRALMRVLHLKRLFAGRRRFDDFIMSREPLPDATVEVEALSGALMMVRRESLKEVGMLDEAYFMHCEDLDWCVRFRKSGWKVAFIPTASAVHAKGGSSASRPLRVELHKHIGMIRFYRLHLRRRYPGVLMWAVAISVWVRFVGKALVMLPASARIFVAKRAFRRTAVDEGQNLPALPNERAVLVLGARSHIGDHLIPLLLDAGFGVVAVTRRLTGTEPSRPGLVWVQMPERGESFAVAARLVAAVALVPLAAVPPLIGTLAKAGISRLIAFGSTNLFTRQASADANERALVDGLRRAEMQIAESCGRHGIAWTIFRPTLVYSWGRDRTVSEIGRFIMRFHFFPLLGSGNGKRQPVHAADLASACLRAMENASTCGRSYNLAGARRITYRAMVEEVFRAMDRRPHIITVPGWAIRAGIRCFRLLPRHRHLSPELATRMETDMCFDSDAARADFGFDPRPFGLAGQEAGNPGKICAAPVKTNGGFR